MLESDIEVQSQEAPLATSWQYSPSDSEQGLPEPQPQTPAVLRINGLISDSEEERRWRAYQQAAADYGQRQNGEEVVPNLARRGRTIEATASGLVQASVDMGQHLADNLGTVIRSFREDIERQHEQAQRLYEAVRREDTRRHRDVLQGDRAVQQPLPVGTAQEPEETMHLRGGAGNRQPQESRAAPQSLPIRTVQEPPETIHLLGGSGSPQQPRVPTQDLPMPTAEFEARIGKKAHVKTE